MIANEESTCNSRVTYGGGGGIVSVQAPGYLYKKCSPVVVEVFFPLARSAKGFYPLHDDCYFFLSRLTGLVWPKQLEQLNTIFFLLFSS